ncbi:MAG TPA: phospholipase D-like domain-containing protein [Gemmatimonadales bacterium]|nr:phospholipase D-like domain-containing protein [Gemmatimonadales bacterium]
MQPWAVSALVAAVHVGLALTVSAHIVLTKPDVRAAIGWVGLVWLTPVLGSVSYLLFGVNRIRRQAGRMRRGRILPWTNPPGPATLPRDETPLPDGVAPSMRPLATLVGAITGTPLTAGNAVEVLANGDAAYPAMLAAINAATRSVALTTYIFDRGQVADQFIDALARAVRRGVAVRVLIDGVGARYSHPPIVRTLRAHHIPVGRFLPPYIAHPFVNLRNHRKLMVVDGTVGFCGGLNIRDDCLLALNPPTPTQDLHFRLRGPVVRQLMTAVAFDWAFTTGEQLAGRLWFAPLEPAGSVLARGIPDGPDEDFETLLMTFLGALAQATRSVRLATPYFLPDPPLVDALRVAALRGVQVDILLPARGNIRLVQWAATAQLAQVVRWGCQVYLSPPPFDHSKLLLVDGEWSLIGSANWDPRSLRLNFEYAVECYSRDLAGELGEAFDAKLRSARALTVADLERRTLPVKLRDGVAWLAQPYL